jgi:hypothetical protein
MSVRLTMHPCHPLFLATHVPQVQDLQVSEQKGTSNGPFLATAPEASRHAARQPGHLQALEDAASGGGRLLSAHDLEVPGLAITGADTLAAAAVQRPPRAPLRVQVSARPQQEPFIDECHMHAAVVKCPCCTHSHSLCITVCLPSAFISSVRSYVQALCAGDAQPLTCCIRQPHTCTMHQLTLTANMLMRATPPSARQTLSLRVCLPVAQAPAKAAAAAAAGGLAAAGRKQFAVTSTSSSSRPQQQAAETAAAASRLPDGSGWPASGARSDAASILTAGGAGATKVSCTTIGWA